MTYRRKNMVLFILSLFSVNVFGLDKKVTTLPADSSAALDSLYIEFSSHGPQFAFAPLLFKALWVVIIIIAGVLIWRYLIKPLLLFVREKYATGEQIFISARIIVIMTTLCLIMTEIINPTETVSTIILAAAGLSAALAARGILHDFFSGLVLIFNHSLKAGDYLLGSESAGRVKKIGLINTSIETKFGEIHLYPNHRLTAEVMNRLKSDNPVAPVAVDFYLPQTADIIAIKEIAGRAASLSRFIYLNKPVTVTFDNLFQEGNSALHMQIYAYALHVDYIDQLKSDITENVTRELLHIKKPASLV